jgi:hypothetical protein
MFLFFNFFYILNNIIKMFNLPSYYKSIQEYKKNKTEFEKVKTEIETEFKSFLKNVKTLNNNYFITIDEELKKNELFFLENMLIDKNIYDDVITYNKYIEQIIENAKIDDLDKFKIATESINFDLKIVNLLKEMIANIVEHYTKDLTPGAVEYKPVELFFYNKIKNLKIDKLNLSIDDYYNIESNETFNKYSIKPKIGEDLQTTKTKLNTYISSINEDNFKKNSAKYKMSISQDQIQTINSILKTFNYDSVQNIVFPQQPDNAEPIPISAPIPALVSSPAPAPAPAPLPTRTTSRRGGGFNFETDNKLLDHQKYILKSLSEQSKLRSHIEEINKNINEYFVLLYDVYLYNIFFINEQQNRAYSLFVYDNLPYELIEKVYNNIKSIPNLNLDRYKIVFKIIDTYLSTNKSTKGNLSIIKKNLNFVLLVDKLNILLRQYNDKKINTNISSKYDSNEIFMLGNRSLENELWIFFDIRNLSISTPEEYLELIGKIMFNFLVPNLYLIKNIESPDFKNIWKIQDLLLTYYISNSNLHSKVVKYGYELTINENKKYYFINYTKFTKYEARAKASNYLIINLSP